MPFREKLLSAHRRVVRAVSNQTLPRDRALTTPTTEQSASEPNHPTSGSANTTKPSLHLDPKLPGTDVLIQSVVPDPALTAAVEKYAAKLSELDKQAFLSATDIMRKIEEQDVEHSQSSLSRSFGARIQALLQVVHRFTTSVAICIQHSPEISSLVVGGLNCVLGLVLGYIEFFESLTTMMEQIGCHLNYLSLYGSQMFQKSAEVQKALVDAYCDLLDFFVGVRAIFGDRSSRFKSFRLFLKVQWEPFKSKFQPIQNRFLEHTIVVVRSAQVQDLIKRYEDEQRKAENQKDKKRRKVLAWLSSVDFEEAHQRHYTKRFGNTGQWLLDHSDFQTWRDTQGSSLLWCHGLPGTGKTVLASLALETVSAQYALSKDNAICFAYCNFKEPQQAATYVRVFIKQLCREMKNLPVDLEAFYDNHHRNASNPGLTALQAVLTQVLRCFARVFVVVDALDECSKEERQDLVKILCTIVSPGQSTHGNIKVFVTSRREQDILRALADFPVVEIEAKKVNNDIESYVMAQLEKHVKDKTLELTADLKSSILRAFVNQAGGMFLWVDFQLKHILSLPSHHDILGALNELPEDMEQTYNRIIQLIQQKPKPQRKLARKVIMWVLYSTRPLRLGELLCAVTMEDGMESNESLLAMLPKTETLVDICTNLITIDTIDTDHYEDVVRFIHFSAQEFFLGPPLAACTGTPFSAMTTLNISPQDAHKHIARICINVLSLCIRCGYEGDDEHRLYHPPITNYAMDAWSDHIRQLTTISEELLLNLLKLWDFGIFFEYYGMDVKRSTKTCNPWYYMRRQAHRKFSPSTISLIFNLPVVLKCLPKALCDKRYPDDRLAVSSLYSGGSGDTKLLQLLLDRGADINAEGINGNALSDAAERGDIQVVQLLLDKGADINAKVGFCGNAFQAAARQGNIQVIQLLLDRGADINAKGGFYGTALQAAANEGNVQVVRLLLDRGADVNAGGGNYGGSLQAAAFDGKSEVIQLLLDRGADINAEGGDHGTALECATYRGHIQVIQLLLDRGANINARFGGALEAAASMAKREVVELLLDRGANVNAEGGYYGTALSAAVYFDRVRVVQLLLDRGADINARYGSALRAAASKGEIEVVRLLLDRGADINAGGGFYGTAMQAVAREGNVEIIQLLLDRGADINAQYGSALRAAASKGEIEIVRLLLDRGADINAGGGFYGTALQVAARKGKVQVVQLLLDRGAKVIAKGGIYGHTLDAAGRRARKGNWRLSV